MGQIIVTGGAGYIGSHTVLELLNNGIEVIVVDNLERGYHKALSRIESICGKKITFEQCDLRDKNAIGETIAKYSQADAVIHFAAYKNVGEADKHPELYLENNIIGSFNLLEAMRLSGVRNIVFSSTSAVYGDSEILPMHEELPIQPKNAYGQSKAAVEWMIRDYVSAYGFGGIALRYFNAAGAHESGQIGEDPKLSGNVIPLIMQTLIGKRDEFVLFGDQFSTSDGTQERDYIHVMDLASGHLAAYRKLMNKEQEFAVYNLGTGQSTSNANLIKIAQEISGLHLKYMVDPPRQGDPVITVSDPTKANRELGWQATRDIYKIVEDQWNWVSTNTEGYGE